MRTKKKRKYDVRLVKARRAYSFAEIAEILKTHVRTVQIWRKDGLKILDDGIKPFLVMGQDIHDFLRERVAKRKKPLLAGEFFCPKCQSARKSSAEQLGLDFTKRMLGVKHRQVIVRGICEVCGSRLSLFSSEQKVTEWLKTAVMLAERAQALISIEESSTNTDMSEEA